ncbi:hypothetical protein MNV49_006698 [Pseudohyphozyma bogoriensis]|nr:hypothetical protein MNV49_006698 [Pseudohyphozyma bogoriensis]
MSALSHSPPLHQPAPSSSSSAARQQHPPRSLPAASSLSGPSSRPLSPANPPAATNGHHRASIGTMASQAPPAPPASSSYGPHSNPPPPPLSVGSAPPMQGPSVLQILTMGQERNHAADAMAHHPRIESLIKLGKESEQTWLQIGATAESLGDLERAVASYESALRHNAYCIQALRQIATICRTKEDFKKAAEYFGRVVGLSPENGEVWGALGHCYLMIDDLKKAYSSYQQALYYMPNPQEPKLWYGIGILYDRYGSLEHAEEAFSSVIRMDPTFEKANEIFFRLGIIYKQQRKSHQSLECFRYILSNPPRPLTEIDIWFQIGHVYEQQKDFLAAKESYERVLAENPAHAKVLQQLGGLYHRSRAPFYNPDISVQILTKSLESDANDPFSWYLLGRAYMTTANFGKAYEAYQQAVYRDGKNPAFWCSIGVLYYNINQYHDALDAYSRAIRIHPYLAEVWFNLGALYESCNDQMTDAIDAYQRTQQLDPSNTIVSVRLREIREHQASGAALSPPPQPKDISPSSASWSYATNTNGTAATLQSGPGLGPELSPSQGRPTTVNGTPLSPPGSHRFEGPPPTGRPRSTDPYRNEERRRTSGPQHSPQADQSPRQASAHRLSGPPPSHLSQLKGGSDPRRSPTLPVPGPIAGRHSPLSPRTRDDRGENGSYSGGYAPPGGPAFSRGGPDDMDWERSGGKNGSTNGRASAQSHRRSPPGSSHSRDAPFNAYPYDRHGPSPSASRPAGEDRDSRNGSYPPVGYGTTMPPDGGPSRRYDPRDPVPVDEEERRRSLGEVSPKSTAPEQAAPAKGKGGRGKKDESTPGGKRKGKDSDGAPAAKKERKQPAEKKADGRRKNGGAKGARHTASSKGSPSPPPAGAARDIDEDYDEGVDEGVNALMGLASGSHSPPSNNPLLAAAAAAAAEAGSEEAPAPEPAAVQDDDSASANPRKRSIGSLENGGEDAGTKRAKSVAGSPIATLPSVLPPLPPIPTDEPAAEEDKEVEKKEEQPAEEPKEEEKKGEEEVAAPEDKMEEEKKEEEAPKAAEEEEALKKSVVEEEPKEDGEMEEGEV